MKTQYAKMKSFMAKNCAERMSAVELKEESEKLYIKHLDEEARLLELYNKKKLTNKNTIRKARAIANRINTEKKDN